MGVVAREVIDLVSRYSEFLADVAVGCFRHQDKFHQAPTLLNRQKFKPRRFPDAALPKKTLNPAGWQPEFSRNRNGALVAFGGFQEQFLCTRRNGCPSQAPYSVRPRDLGNPAYGHQPIERNLFVETALLNFYDDQRDFLLVQVTHLGAENRIGSRTFMQLSKVLAIGFNARTIERWIIEAPFCKPGLVSLSFGSVPPFAPRFSNESVSLRCPLSTLAIASGLAKVGEVGLTFRGLSPLVSSILKAANFRTLFSHGPLGLPTTEKRSRSAASVVPVFPEGSRCLATKTPRAGSWREHADRCGVPMRVGAHLPKTRQKEEHAAPNVACAAPEPLQIT